ncbi:MAG: helix-turn-helix domain-containing protein [Verrucomicrobiales bacterium]|nr:helix-turn-helix domain-containing protein [Verrucomicrobiales bacterium]MCP5528539.1 helix-turn-helix domain-containing protein [Verrucomicrobiales bacterium]
MAEQLKSARESRHLSVHRVAEITRMRADHVQALERGDYRAFVAPVYIRGFVRAYARCVHLDEAAIMTALDGELASRRESGARPGVPVDADQPRPARLPRVFSGRWQVLAPVAAGVFAAVGGFFLLRFWWTSPGDDPLAGIAPGYHQGPFVAETLPLPAEVPR